MWNFLLAFIPRAIVQGIPLLFGSTGEIVTEKSGNLVGVKAVGIEDEVMLITELKAKDAILSLICDIAIVECRANMFILAADTVSKQTYTKDQTDNDRQH